MEDIFKFVNDESQSTQGGRFGLNEKAIVDNVQLLKTKDNNDYIKITFLIGDSEHNMFIFDVNKKSSLYLKGNRVQPGTKDHAIALRNKIKSVLATITHVLKAFGLNSEEFQKTLAKTPARSMIDYFKKGLKHCDSKKIQGKVVDIFLEYQTKIPKNSNKTYLQIPQYVYDGKFLIEHIEPVGKWNEIIDEREGLYYQDDSGNKHPFKRNAEYMASFKAKRQFLEGEDEPSSDSVKNILSSANELPAQPDIMEPRPDLSEDIENDDDGLPF